MSNTGSLPQPPSAPPTPFKTSLGRVGRLLCCLFVLYTAPCAWAELAPSQVLILVNRDVKVSAEIAQMYQKLRRVPESNVLSLSLGTSREITLPDYRSRVADPVRKYLESKPEIRCLLTTSGFPYTLQVPAEEGAAVDNELAAVLLPEPKDRRPGRINPLFFDGFNIYGITDPRKLKMVYVARLDGPDVKLITSMVKDAIETEKTGLQGPVFGDARGIDGITGLGLGDRSVRAAIDRLSGAGFPATLDLKEETWTQPPGGVGGQAAGAAFYVGWYRPRDFQDIFGPRGLARGAIAWHIGSGEAVNLWDPNEKGWCVNLLRRGAAVTLGAVREPFVQAFPRGGVFAERLLSGATVAESYWQALPNTSWNIVLLGDPLYRPWGLKPRPSLVARAYLSEDSGHILKQGKTSPLLIQIQCIGPAGSSTPALQATAEPGTGLGAASGSVSIPPLRAGQATLVRVPTVTAGDDPSGMFRLNLNVSGEQGISRRIVLEGRAGFSRLSGGLLPDSQMFASPNGEFVISGRLGSSELIETETLRSHSILLPKGVALVGAIFSPDSEHVTLAVVEPIQKKAGFLIVNDKMAEPRPIPEGMRFLRWLDNDKVLLQGPQGLVSHSVARGEDHPIDTPAGWIGTVIPGTDIEILHSKEGKVAVKRGSEPLHEILRGVQGLRDFAVANDLSMFGGVDNQKRFWVQHGLDGSPEVVDSPVEQVQWGPISHRALVREPGGKARVYDGRDRSWIDLGKVFGAHWSFNEEWLLFTEVVTEGNQKPQEYLSLLANGAVRRLCPVERLGEIREATFSPDGQRAFLLAGLDGGMEVWLMDLTLRIPAGRTAPKESPAPAPKRPIVIAH